jgi:hypothetical protein
MAESDPKQEYVEEKPELSAKPDEQDIDIQYNEQAKQLFAELDTKLDAGKSTLAFAIVMLPEFPDRPLIYARGGLYPIAKLISSAARYYKNKVMTELE